MVRVQLSERQWSKIEALLRSERRAGRPAYDDRKFVEAVLWWRRTRYEKTLRNYAAVVALGCALLWLRI
jgi:transposase